MNRFARSVLLRRRQPGRALFALLAALALVTLAGATGAFAQANTGWFDFKLINSEIVAGSSTITPGQDVTFTVILRNDAANSDTIDVTVQYPVELAYVGGSATGGTHSAADRAISWSGIPVAGGGDERLTFKLRTAGAVSSSKNVQVYAAIAGQQEHIIRATSITVTPGGTEPPPAEAKLSESTKRADKGEVGPGEQLRYVITLRNTGSAAATVDVNDPLPAELSYVNGSATNGGSYDSGARRVSWDNIAVPAGESIELAFKATAPETIAAAKDVVNTATIQFNGSSFTRSYTVRLVPTDEPPPPDSGTPRLEASVKLANRLAARPDDTIEYRIVLYNNGTASGSVSVRDPLPEALSYVDGSASNDGSYNASSRTVSWDDITVGVGRQVTLSFKAKPAGASDTPRAVENTAAISVGDTTLRRSFTVVLLPAGAPDGGDVIPPAVKGVTIGEADVLTGRETTVHVVATDNEGVTELFLREWQLVTGRGIPHWKVIRSSGWIDYDDTVPWTLGDDAGTHYIGVWARDAAGNVSSLGSLAVDFASLVEPETSVAAGRAVLYQVYYPAGVNVEVTLTPESGDPDLYVWYPGGVLFPDKISNADGEATDSVTFTTPRAGVYLIAVVGHTSATYDLAFSASGGPRMAAIGFAEADTTAVSFVNTAKTAPQMTALIGDAGFDPLGNVSATTTDISSLYLPVVHQP